MNSTNTSDNLLEVVDLKVHFQLDHYLRQDVRDLFVSALTHPFDFFFKPKEIFYALKGVSFTVKKGMRLGIIGINGSGKTTLCRCLAGMIVAQQGRIIHHGEVRAIFDTGTGVMPELTGRENAYLLARLFYPNIKNLTPLVNEAIEFSELDHFIDIPFKQYSKGMQSRLLLSLISSQTSDVLILDEVFDGADHFFQKKIAERMIDFIHKAGATIFVTHTIDQIRDVCNTLLVMHKGEVLHFGDIEEGIKIYLKHNQQEGAQ